MKLKTDHPAQNHPDIEPRECVVKTCEWNSGGFDAGAGHPACSFDEGGASPPCLYGMIAAHGGLGPKQLARYEESKGKHL